MISFWRNAMGHLYVEKEDDVHCQWIRLTESEITDMLAYIEQNMSELWAKATEDVVKEAIEDARGYWDNGGN